MGIDILGQRGYDDDTVGRNKKQIQGYIKLEEDHISDQISLKVHRLVYG